MLRAVHQPCAMSNAFQGKAAPLLVVCCAIQPLGQASTNNVPMSAPLLKPLPPSAGKQQVALTGLHRRWLEGLSVGWLPYVWSAAWLDIVAGERDVVVGLRKLSRQHRLLCHYLHILRHLRTLRSLFRQATSIFTQSASIHILLATVHASSEMYASSIVETKLYAYAVQNKHMTH